MPRLLSWSGYVSPSETQALYVYDPVADAWSPKAAPNVRRHGFAAGAIDGRLYVAGGWDGGSMRDELEVYDFNPRARHVYQKVGFVVEGVRRDALWWDGAWHGAVTMAILAPEWRARSRASRH